MKCTDPTCIHEKDGECKNEKAIECNRAVKDDKKK